jgi:hypothetical protein
MWLLQKLMLPVKYEMGFYIPEGSVLRITCSVHFMYDTRDHVISGLPPPCRLILRITRTDICEGLICHAEANRRQWMFTLP